MSHGTIIGHIAFHEGVSMWRSFKCSQRKCSADRPVQWSECDNTQVITCQGGLSISCICPYLGSTIKIKYVTKYEQNIYWGNSDLY